MSGDRPERLLNLAARHGITLWRVRRTPWGATGCVGLVAYRRLRPLVRRSGCRVRILRRRGLPFLWRRLGRRRAFLVAAAVLLVALHLAGGRVWVVEVRGGERVSPAAVRAAAARLGLRPGVARAAVDGRRVGSDLPLLLPDVAWAGVRFRGTRAIVEIVERTVLPPGGGPADAPGDVVARRDGLVTHLLVLSGEPVVREGQVVTAGQVLVRGVVRRWPAPARQGTRPVEVAQPARAAAVVRGRVWYRLEAEEPTLIREPVLTGRARVRRQLVIRPLRLTLGGLGPAPFADYVARETLLRFPGEVGVEPVLEVKIIHYAEVRRRLRAVPQAEAVLRGEARLRRRLAALLPPGTRIMSERAAVRPAGTGVVRVDLLVETEEDLGRFRPAAGRGRAEPGGGEGEGEAAAARPRPGPDAGPVRTRR